MKIVFFGTPAFSAQVLDYLLQHDVQVAAVVTRTDKPKGRTGHPVLTPVKELILNKYPGIPVLQPEKVSAPDSADVLPPFEADLFIVVAYGEILKQHILDMPKSACINLHTSLLPKYRGAAPIQRCVINGEKETGVTIMHMLQKMDAGNMIRAASVSIGQNETFGEIEKKLCLLGSELLLDVIREYEKHPLRGIPQKESEATLAPKIELEDCEIDWNKDALMIHNLVRGVNPYPGAWCRILVKDLQKRLKIHRTEYQADVQGIPGEILSCDATGMIVGCGSGALKITELQLEGKRPMTPEELLRGTPLRDLRDYTARR